MATASCAMCGKSVDEAKLLFSDEGRICGSCELELGDRETVSNAQWGIAVGGPLMAFTGCILLCGSIIPVIGLVAGALTPFVAILAIGLGVQAFMKAGEAEGGIRTLTVVGAAFAVPTGLSLLVVSVLMILTQLVQLAGF